MKAISGNRPQKTSRKKERVMSQGIRLSIVVIALLVVVSKGENQASAAEEGVAGNTAASKTEESALTPQESAVTPSGEGVQASTENKSEVANPDGLQVAELIVARGIEAKKPLDPKSSYKLGEFDRIVAYMTLHNPTETADEIAVSFLNVESGKERGKVTVSVGAQKKWRTWAFSKMINKAGKWEIIVRDKNDNVLGRAPFEILE
jgi:hypothetical protein